MVHKGSFFFTDHFIGKSVGVVSLTWFPLYLQKHADQTMTIFSQIPALFLFSKIDENF